MLGVSKCLTRAVSAKSPISAFAALRITIDDQPSRNYLDVHIGCGRSPNVTRAAFAGGLWRDLLLLAMAGRPRFMGR